MQLKFQQYIDRLEEWCNDWFIKINPTKTQLICFSKKHTPPKINLTLLGEQLQYSDTVLFLGIKFDKILNWNSHIDKIKTTMWRKTNILRSLTGKKWSANPQLLIKIFQQWALPNAAYACLTYLSASIHTLYKLQVLQNSIIRSAYKLPRNTTVKRLHEIANIPLIQDHLIKTGNQQYNRIKNVDILQNTLMNYTYIKHKITYKSPLDMIAPN